MTLTSRPGDPVTPSRAGPGPEQRQSVFGIPPGLQGQGAAALSGDRRGESLAAGFTAHIQQPIPA